MVRQIYWVLRSYLANKLFSRLLAAFGLWGLVVLANLLTSKSYHSNYPETPRGRPGVSTLDSLMYVRREKRQDQVDTLYLGGIWGDMERRGRAANGEVKPARYQAAAPPESFYDIIDEFPNLRIVGTDMSNVDSAPALRRLAGRQGIEFLSLSGKDPLDMSAVAKLPGLKRLELSSDTPVPDIKKLASLANLEMLVFTSERGVDDTVLSEIAQLPHLEVLVLRWNYFNHGITDAGIKQLENSPNLKTFYVGGQRVPPQADLIVRGRALLSTIDVQPALVLQGLPWVVGFFPAGLAMGIGVVVASQLSTSASRLAPGFLLTHAVTAFVWLGTTVMVMALSMYVLWQPFVQSLVVCTAATLFFFSIGVDSISKRLLGLAARVTLWDWVIALGTPIVIYAIAFPAVRESAIRGRLTLVVLAGAFAAAAAWHAVTTLYRLSRVQTAGLPSQQYNGQSLLGISRGLLLSRRERFLESSCAIPARWTLWKSLQRWRAGNAPLAVMLFILYFPIGVAPVLFTLAQARDEMMVKVNLWVIPLFLLLLITGQVALVWRRRVTCLAVESLRPISRSVLQRQWALAMLLDLFVPSLSLSLLVAVASQLNLSSFRLGGWYMAVPGWQNLLAAAVILTVTLWIISAAVCSLAIVIERQWVRLALFLPLLLASCLGLGFFVTHRTGIPLGSVTAWDVLPLLWAPVMLYAAVLAWMWRQWTRIDFDRSS